jgi:hypothetical protein
MKEALPSGRTLPPPRVLPDESICRAKNSGFASYPDYADCLVESPHECRHALHFGMRSFCRHPNRMEIVKRSAAESSGSSPLETNPQA